MGVVVHDRLWSRSDNDLVIFYFFIIDIFFSFTYYLRMKKITAFCALLFVALSLSALTFEGGLGLSGTMNEKKDHLFVDGAVSYDDFSLYLAYKGGGKLNATAEYYNKKGILNHQLDLFTGYVFSEGGYTALSYLMRLNFKIYGFYFDIGGGAEGALSYSEYTKLPLFILSPQFSIRLGYRNTLFDLALFLENNYRYEKEWNAKTSYGIDTVFNLTPKDSVLVSISFTHAEVLMDNYRVLYASRIRAGYRRII